MMGDTTGLRRYIIIATAIITGIALLLLYAKTDPAAGYFPRCVFLQITGLQCPGCGSQRALHALLTGNLAAAWAYNPLVIIGLPAVITLAIASSVKYRHPRFYNAANSRYVILAALIIVVGWWILRNVLNYVKIF